MPDVLHALCNAHHLRELQELDEIEHGGWAELAKVPLACLQANGMPTEGSMMQTLLRRACHAMNLARREKIMPPAGIIDLIIRRYDAIVAEGLAFHEAQPYPAINPKQDGSPRRGRPPRLIGRNLLLRLQHRKDDVLRFLGNPDVPTNSEAERDGRMLKPR